MARYKLELQNSSRKLSQKDTLIKELNNELSKSSHDASILQKSLSQKDRHIAILLKDLERTKGLGDKVKEDCLIENLKFNYSTGKVIGDEECILSESNVK